MKTRQKKPLLFNSCGLIVSYIYYRLTYISAKINFKNTKENLTSNVI